MSENKRVTLWGVTWQGRVPRIASIEATETEKCWIPDSEIAAFGWARILPRRKYKPAFSSEEAIAKERLRLLAQMAGLERQLNDAAKQLQDLDFISCEWVDAAGEER